MLVVLPDHALVHDRTERQGWQGAGSYAGRRLWRSSRPSSAGADSRPERASGDADASSERVGPAQHAQLFRTSPRKLPTTSEKRRGLPVVLTTARGDAEVVARQEVTR
jgi:hypothetical protein